MTRSSIFKEKYGEKDLTVIAIGPGGENLVKFACWINENDRASGRGGTGCVGGSKNLKAVVIKAEKKHHQSGRTAKPGNRRTTARCKVIMAEENITSPRKGGLSVYGTNVLMNITSNIGALPDQEQQADFLWRGCRKDQRRVRQGAHPGRRPHLPRLPGGLQEGSRDQGRPVEGSAHGKRRVRAGLVGGRQRGQQRRQHRRQDDRLCATTTAWMPSRSAIRCPSGWKPPRRAGPTATAA